MLPVPGKSSGMCGGTTIFFPARPALLDITAGRVPLGSNLGSVAFATALARAAVLPQLKVDRLCSVVGGTADFDPKPTNAHRPLACSGERASQAVELRIAGRGIYSRIEPHYQPADLLVCGPFPPPASQ
jgi:hypothetical protein